VRTGGVAFLVARIIAPLICPRSKRDRDLISPSKIDIQETERPVLERAISGVEPGAPPVC